MTCKNYKEKNERFENSTQKNEKLEKFKEKNKLTETLLRKKWEIWKFENFSEAMKILKSRKRW